MTCEHLNGTTCGIASEFAGACITTSPDACRLCERHEKPMQLNDITAGLIVKSDPRLLPHVQQFLTIPEYMVKGPGTELKKLIAWLWSPTSKCQTCTDRAIKMNKWGAAKCRKRKKLIVAWLKQSASKQGLPFSELVASALVELAIKSAERKEEPQRTVPKIGTPEPETVAPKPKYSAVWVYWKGGAHSDELEYSIRSAITHLGDLLNVVVCGDHPGDWYDGDFIQSRRFNKQDGIAKFGSGRFVKWIDSAIKLQRIIDSDLVSDSFLWMYDDTFFLQPWSIEQTAVLRAGGELWDRFKLQTPARHSWREVMRRTAKALTDRGLPQRNYSTHYPVVYQKSLLRQTLKDFGMLENARLVESVYLNHHFREPGPVSEVFQYVKKPTKDWSPRPGIPVVNVGGFNSRVQEVIKPLFPEHQLTPTMERVTCFQN